jgi:hypothetical protein
MTKTKKKDKKNETLEFDLDECVEELGLGNHVNVIRCLTYDVVRIVEKFAENNGGRAPTYGEVWDVINGYVWEDFNGDVKGLVYQDADGEEL